LEYNAKLTPLDGKPILDAICYRQLVGSLIYLIVTRLDISHAMSMVNKFMDGPRSVHYIVVLRILQYVKGTLYHGLHYSFRSSLIQMWIEQVIRLIDASSQVFVSCWVFLLCYGIARSRTWFVVPVLRLSILPLLTPLVSLSSFDGS